MSLKLYEVRVDKGLTSNYHSGGLVVVIAKSAEQALIVAKARASADTEDEFTLKEEITGHEIEEGLSLVGRNAGCC